MSKLHCLRWLVLQSCFIAGVIALYIAGLAQLPFTGERTTAILCGVIVGVLTVGIFAALFGRWNDVSWIATHILRLGLLGTVIGLLLAFHAAGTGISSNPDEMRGLVVGVINGMFVALYVTLFGVTGNLWLKLNMKLLGGDDG